MHTSNFKKDFYDLADHMRGGHMQHWLYSDEMRRTLTGSQLWTQFYRSSRGYYIPRDEKRLIRDRVRSLVGNSDADTLVDFGVGAEAFTDKVTHVIENLRNLKRYVGVDLSEDMLETVGKTARNLYPSLNIKLKNQNFHENKIDLSGEKRLGLIFGCSITNQEMREGQGFPHDSVVADIHDFFEHIGEDSELLVTYDSNPDGEHAMAAYRSPYWSEYVLGFMYDAERKLKTGGDFSASDWHAEITWDRNVHVIHQCVVADRAQTLETDDRTFRFQRGERFVAVNNFKFPESVFNEVCEDAGFAVGNRVSNNTIQLQHLTRQ